MSFKKYAVLRIMSTAGICICAAVFIRMLVPGRLNEWCESLTETWQTILIIVLATVALSLLVAYNTLDKIYSKVLSEELNDVIELHIKADKEFQVTASVGPNKQEGDV